MNNNDVYALINKTLGDYVDLCVHSTMRENTHFMRWERLGYMRAEHCRVGRYRLLKSYDTVVGVGDTSTSKFYEFGKYSPTTSRQVNKFCSIFGFEKELVERGHLPYIECMAKTYW